MFVFDIFDIDNHDVFISYAKKDATRIKPLRDALTAAGIKYWIDDRIDGSENFLAEIPDAIKKCSIVLFVASQNSANSEWTQKELVYAHKFKKEIFPYKLDDFQFENCVELDFFFTNIQWKENVGDVVAGLGKKLGINVPTQTTPSVMKRMTGTLIIKTDLDCRVFNYGEEIGVVKAGEYTKFELPLGDNELKYVGLENEEDSYEEPIVIDEKYQKSIRIALLDIYNARKSKEEAEHKAKERAERRIEQNKRLIWSTSRNVVEQQPQKIRLIQVAKEFKVGMSTLIDFLYEKDVGVNWTSNSIVSSDIYSMLEMEFGLKRRVAGYHDILNKK